ncbi:MAG: UbiA family prenyltransferase [Candidatus Thermoplasmatota archaeon]|nr:UbiA family prenyltransferase [Candidatus Thermoplasmatota archaeon]
MNKAYAWFRIVRPPIVFIGVFGSTVTALIFQGTPGAMDFAVPLHLWAFIWSMFCWGMLWGGIMVHNDYTDLKSDKYNKPHKPIPCGAITPRQAHLGGLAMMTFGWLLPIPILMLIDVWFAVAAAFWGFTLWFVGVYYDYWGKGHGAAGHASVAWGVALIPLYGGALVSPYAGFALLLPLFLALFISEIGREILVCCHDYYGDIKQGWLTTPVVRGRMTAMRHVPIWYLGFIPFYAIPYFGWLGYPAYFSPIYFWGYTIFILGLYVTWAAIYKTMLGTRDEKKIQWSFELYARTGTRLFIIFTQFVMLAEAFWGAGAV